MKMRMLVSMIIAVASLTLSGCGGGGGGAAHTVSGVASKGLIKNGTNNVKVFALNSDGTKGALLATTSTGANGDYTANLGGYTGAVLVEVSGTYSDEATGQPVTIAADKPLRAAFDNVTGDATVAVTPLTELAVQKAGAALTKDNIKAANTAVSAFFNVDVIATKPVDASATALGASGVTADQKNYTLALAAVSQMANSGTADAVYAVLTKIQTDNDPSKTAAQFNLALNDFAVNDKNKTGVTSSTLPVELVNVGAKTALVKLSISGITGNIYGVDLTLDLPAGVTVAADADGAVSPSILKAVGTAAASAFTAAKYTAASGATRGKLHLALANTSGFTAGEFVDVSCAVAQGVTPTFGNGLLEPGIQVKDANGVNLGTGTVTLSAVF